MKVKGRLRVPLVTYFRGRMVPWTRANGGPMQMPGPLGGIHSFSNCELGEGGRRVSVA